MGGQQQLRKRLKSIKLRHHANTRQLAEADAQAAATINTRADKARARVLLYRRRGDILSLLGRSRDLPPTGRTREELVCSVAIGGNRGPCGGYNSNELRLGRGNPHRGRNAAMISCSRKASAYLREHSLGYVEFILSDVPPPIYEGTHALWRAIWRGCTAPVRWMPSSGSLPALPEQSPFSRAVCAAAAAAAPAGKARGK